MAFLVDDILLFPVKAPIWVGKKISEIPAIVVIGIYVLAQQCNLREAFPGDLFDLVEDIFN